MFGERCSFPTNSSPPDMSCGPAVWPDLPALATCPKRPRRPHGGAPRHATGGGNTRGTARRGPAPATSPRRTKSEGRGLDPPAFGVARGRVDGATLAGHADMANKRAQKRARGPSLRSLCPLRDALFRVSGVRRRPDLLRSSVSLRGTRRDRARREEASPRKRGGEPRSPRRAAGVSRPSRGGSGYQGVGHVRQGLARRPCARLRPGA